MKGAAAVGLYFLLCGVGEGPGLLNKLDWAKGSKGAQALINKAPKLSLERRVKAELFFLTKLNESFAFQGKYFTGNIQERILKGMKKGAKKGTFMAP